MRINFKMRNERFTLIYTFCKDAKNISSKATYPYTLYQRPLVYARQPLRYNGISNRQIFHGQVFLT